MTDEKQAEKQGQAVSERCSKKFFRDWRTVQCKNKAKRDGYCTIHHPDTVQARNDKTMARYRAESAERTKRWELEKRAPELESENARLLSENAALRERGEALRKSFCKEFCMEHEILPTSHVPECEAFRDVLLGRHTLAGGKA